MGVKGGPAWLSGVVPEIWSQKCDCPRPECRIGRGQSHPLRPKPRQGSRCNGSLGGSAGQGFGGVRYEVG